MFAFAITARTLMRNMASLLRTREVVETFLQTFGTTPKMYLSNPPNDDSGEKKDKFNAMQVIDVDVEQYDGFDDEDDGMGPQTTLSKYGTVTDIRLWTHEYDAEDDVIGGSKNCKYRIVDPSNSAAKAATVAKEFENLRDPPGWLKNKDALLKNNGGMCIPSKGADVADALNKKKKKK